MLRNFINRNFLSLPEVLTCHISDYAFRSYPYLKELKELIHAFPNDTTFNGFNAIGDLPFNPFSDLTYESTSIKSSFYTWIISLIFYYNEYTDYKSFDYEECLSIDNYDLLWGQAVDSHYEEMHEYI